MNETTKPRRIWNTKHWFIGPDRNNTWAITQKSPDSIGGHCIFVNEEELNDLVAWLRSIGKIS